MSLPDVVETLIIPDGVAPRSVVARLRPIATDDVTVDAACYTAGGTLVGTRETNPNGQGVVTFTDVHPTEGSGSDAITNPSGVRYQYTVILPDGVVIGPRYITVPDSAGPLDVQDLEVEAPTDLEPPWVPDLQARAEKGDPDGYAALDGDGNVAQLVAYDGTGQPITATAATDAEAVAAVEDELVVVRARPFLGGRLSAVGDSMPQGYTYAGFLATASKPSDMSVVTWACALSGGRLAHVVNHAEGGTTSAQALSTIADVLVEGPSACVILTGANDPGVLTPAQTRANVLAMVQYLRSHDIVPVIGTLIAKDFEQDDHALVNAELRDLADVEDVELWDFAAAIMDPVTGSPLAGMTFDGTHTGPLGARTLAERVVIPRLDDIGARPCPSAWLAPWDDDPSNLVGGACFASGPISAGAPPGWTVSNLSTSGTAARTLVDPDPGSEVQGKWLRFTMADLNGSITESRAVTGWSVGDWLTISVRCRWADLALGDVRWTAGLSFGGSAGTPRPISSWGHSLVGAESAEPAGDVLGDGIIATLTYKVPAGSTSCSYQIAVAGSGDNTGTIDFAQPTVVNRGTTPPGS